LGVATPKETGVEAIAENKCRGGSDLAWHITPHTRLGHRRLKRLIKSLQAHVCVYGVYRPRLIIITHGFG